MNNTELYETLNLSKGASQEEIRKAFRKKAMECHPDKHAGNREKEAEFKKINQAYSVLSDGEKRKIYDQFGVINDQAGMGGVGPGPDLHDILQGMFGGMGGMSGMGGGPPGGFSFVFMGDEEGGIPEDVMGNFFGGGRRAAKPCDIIDIPVDINEIYYGKNKKVEFELLDQCSKCQGTGAADPSYVIKCLTCQGKGSVVHQIGPFMQTSRCHSCSGNGTTIKNNKVCQTCKGQKTVYSKRIFELKIPKGIPNHHELRMEGKGAYDEKLRKNKDILFKFHHEVHQPYEIDPDGNVIYNYKIHIEDLIAGFEKKITIYNEEYTIQSENYINPTKSVIMPGMGTFNMKRNKDMDLTIKLHPEFTESERLVKYNDVIRKILKRVKEPPSGETNKTNKNIINLT